MLKKEAFKILAYLCISFLFLATSLIAMEEEIALQSRSTQYVNAKRMLFKDYAEGEIELKDTVTEMIRLEAIMPSPAYIADENDEDPYNSQYLTYQDRFIRNYGTPECEHEELLQTAFEKYLIYKNTLLPGWFAYRESKSRFAKFVAFHHGENMVENEEHANYFASIKNAKERNAYFKKILGFFKRNVINKSPYKAKKADRKILEAIHHIFRKPFKTRARKLAILYFSSFRNNNFEIAGLNSQQREEIYSYRKARTKKYKEALQAEMGDGEKNPTILLYDRSKDHPTDPTIVTKVAMQVYTKADGPFTQQNGGTYASEVFVFEGLPFIVR